MTPGIYKALCPVRPAASAWRSAAAGSDQDPRAAAFRGLLEFDEASCLTENAGLPECPLILCEYCYGGGGVLPHTKAEHTRKGSTAAKAHDMPGVRGAVVRTAPHQFSTEHLGGSPPMWCHRVPRSLT